MPEILSATLQSIVIWSVVSKITLLPPSNSKELPTGIGASCINMLVPFAVLPVPPLDAVSLTSLTVAVTCDVCILLRTNPRTTLEVLAGQKYILETTDVLRVKSGTASALDAILGIMEIT